MFRRCRARRPRRLRARRHTKVDGSAAPYLINMGRYRQYAGLDEGPLLDGDVGFVGVDEREAALVPPGYVAKAVNYMFRDAAGAGVAKPRKGIVPLRPFGKPFWPVTFPIYWDDPQPFVDVRGAGVFKDPNGLEWVLVATVSEVWACREGNPARQMTFNGRILTGDVDVRFVQAMGVMIMFRGEQDVPYICTDVFLPWRTISLTANTISGAGTYNPSDGTEQIPDAVNGVWMQNRLFVPHSRDLVAVSDYLNYTRYSPTRADFRINQGSEDALVRLYKFGDTSMVAFKKRSVYLVDGVTGDLSGARLKEVTREYGLAAEKAVVATGEDVWFLSQRGVTSIGQSINNAVQEKNETWSDPIPKTIARINWLYAERACAAFHDGRFYLAVPLDDASVTNEAGTVTGVNNAIIVYDFFTGSWQGVWQGPNVCVRDFIVFTLQGKSRLGFLSDEGWVCLMDHTYSDGVRFGEAGLGLAEIETELVTRGYTFQNATTATEGSGVANANVLANAMKRVRRGKVVMSTWRPEFSVNLIFDGVNETTSVVANRTKSRTRSYKAGVGSWDTSNMNDDHGDPYREDYSVDTDPANGGIILGSGVNFEQHQEVVDGFSGRGEGRYCQVQVLNVQGRLELKGVELEGVDGRRRVGVLA